MAINSSAPTWPYHPDSDPSDCRHHARVLVAEDDFATRMIYASMLRAQGYDVTEARNGVELAEQVLNERSIAQLPDVIVTDNSMPVIGGLELMACLRQEGSSIPFIVVSSRLDHNSRDFARSLGASAMFKKPVNSIELTKAIEHCLKSSTRTRR